MADEPLMTEGFWQDRAEEAHLVAKVMSTPEAKVEMLAIASAYARLARRIRHLKQTRATYDNLASRSSQGGSS